MQDLLPLPVSNKSLHEQLFLIDKVLTQIPNFTGWKI